MDVITGFLGFMFTAAFAIVFLSIWIGSIVWAYGDAETRGKTAWLVAVMVAFLQWPMGLVVWLVFRPKGQEQPTPGR